jgi:tRNA dimethylallyltransferase
LIARIPVLVGPTAAGKTAVAVVLGETLDAEVISADSRQVYRGMRVGTAAPTDEQLARVPHHLVSFVDPSETYSAARFRRDAETAFEDVRGRGKTPIIAGGTGLYLRALFGGLFEGPGAFLDVRAELDRRLHEEGMPVLYQELTRLDPASSQLHPNDTARVLRALEVVLVTGRPIGDWREEGEYPEPPGEAVIVGLRVERKVLAERIDERTRRMFRSGLPEETEALLSSGLDPGSPAMSGIGYKEARELLDGKMTLEEAIESTAMRTRRYAKRQMTWFSHQHEVRWLDAGSRSADEIAKRVKTVWKRSGVSL